MKNLKTLTGIKTLSRNDQKSISGGICYEPAFEGSHTEVPVSINGCNPPSQLHACLLGYDSSDPGGGCLPGEFCVLTSEGNRCR